MSAKQPHEYDQRILVAVTGLTPQVVTETLYCLTVKRKLERQAMFLPRRIILLTTDAGRAEVENTLTGGKRKLRQFAKDYAADLGVDETAFEKMTDVLSIVDTQDVHNTAESEAAANNIVNEIRKLIAADKNDRSVIIASIAGGRATMGYLLGYGLGVFGRDQDRLTHVLVTDKDLESAPDFYYPLRDSLAVKGVSGTDRYPGPESLELTDIPFYPLRHTMPAKKFAKLVEDSRPYADVVKSLREHAAMTNKLCFRPGSGKRSGDILCSGELLSGLEAKHYLLYAWVARCKKVGKTIDLNSIDNDTLAEYFRSDPKNRAGLPADIKLTDAWKELRRGLPEADYKSADDYVKDVFSDIKTAIVAALGSEQLAAPYLVTRPGRDGKLHLAVEPVNIEIG